MSVTREAPTAAKKRDKPRRQRLAEVLAEARRQNARLFDEVQAKTHELEEALQEALRQQTATSDILRVIASSGRRQRSSRRLAMSGCLPQSTFYPGRHSVAALSLPVAADSPRLHPHHHVATSGTLQPEMHRIARASPSGDGRVSQAKTGGSGRKEARDLLVRNDKQLGVYGPHDSSPFPKLLTNTSPCKAGFTFAGELRDPRLRRLQFAVERSHSATPGAVTGADTDREGQIHEDGDLPHPHHQDPFISSMDVVVG
jgi:hypothetical protein